MSVRPFVYVASLRRTGSTVLAEALSELPHAFVFREPALVRNKFNFKDQDIALFAGQGVDIAAFVRESAKVPGLWQRFVRGKPQPVDGFARELVPELCSCVEQVGVKEIRHEGWRHYLRNFPEMKIVMTGRDPRDIYLSLQERTQGEGGKGWDGDFGPESVARDLRGQFRFQREMAERCEVMKVRYEDLCTDDALIDEVKRFVASPIPGAAQVGHFNANNPRRQKEYELHGDQITDRRVRRWAQEPNQALVADAQRCFDLMEDYSTFWGYARQ